MARRSMDVAPADPMLADVGLGRGWEPAAIMTLTLLLLSGGLVTLYSASSVLAQRQGLPDWFYVVRQAAGAAVGLVAMVVCARIPYRVWERLAWPLLWGTVALLVLVVLPGTETLAPEVNGARRWLRVGGITLQPSELAKLTIVVWTAMLTLRKQEDFRSLGRGLAPFLLVWGVLVLLVALEPDLSTACVIALLGATVVFAGGARLAHFVFLGILVLPVLKAQLGVSFRAARLVAFLDPATSARGAGYQVQQSLIAIGSGGVTGQGFGGGRQKFGFLPEPHNDFIFAMVGEEWGLLGVVFLVGLYVGLVLLGFRIARRARDRFGQLLAVGLTSLVALQAVLHMAVGLGLVPTTGLALPLVSYGRSNLLVTLAALGILMAVARDTDRDWRPEHVERRRLPDLARADRLAAAGRARA
jgi:cell division protein FtsW